MTVAVYSSLGVDGDGGLPKLDGTDQWTVERSSFLGGDPMSAAFEDRTAWVANGTLVANLNFPVTIGSSSNSPVTVELTNGVIVAKLGRSDAGVPMLEGTFSGRWDSEKMLTSFQASPIRCFPRSACAETRRATRS